MATPWTITAITGAKSALLANATLAAYVDTVEIWDRDRPEDLPALTRHAIVIVPESLSVEVLTPDRNREFMRCRLRLVIAVWDPTNRQVAVTGETVVGVGTSQVGILKFVEDVQNALRKETLSGLLEETAMEADGVAAFVINPRPERDRIFLECSLTWTAEHVAPHVR